MSREPSPLASGPTPSDEAPKPDPLLGRELAGRYTIVAVLGRGGMSQVYEAIQAPLGRRVALKVLRVRGAPDGNLKKRFLFEASVTSHLTHPNTITVFDYGEAEDGTLYLAMELLQGRTLAQVLQREGALPEARVLHIAAQICKSLREAHGNGVVHRDLKPANVFLLDQHDEPDYVKVLDFGLVKAVGREDPTAALTRDGLFLGTAHYIAPEQARNQSPDQRADIYSLGVLLFHLLTGRVPFDGPSSVDVILQHVTEPPPRPRLVRPDLAISPRLEELVLRCLEKQREQRFQSMDEVLLALRQVPGARVPDTMPPAPAPQPPPPRTPAPAPLLQALSEPSVSGEVSIVEEEVVVATPRKRPAALIALVGSVVLVGLVAALALLPRGRQSDAAPATPPPRAQPAPVAESVVAPSAAPPPAAAPPPPELARARNAPDFVLRKEALSLPPLTLSPEARARLQGRGRQVGIYRVCVGVEGRVLAATPVQPISGVDADVVEAMQSQWRYKPQSVPLCAQVSVPIEVE